MEARQHAAAQLQLNHELIRMCISMVQAAAVVFAIKSEDIESDDVESRDGPSRAKAWHSADTHPPKELCCPITLDLLQHPVRTIYGHVFERNTLTRWLDGDNGDTCPITRRPLTVADVTYASDVAEAVHLWTRQAKKREKRKRNRARKQGRKHLRRYGRVVY